MSEKLLKESEGANANKENYEGLNVVSIDEVSGITYAVQFARNGMTYFNLAPISGNNTYTLVNTK